MHFIEGGNLGVPLQESGRGAGSLHGLGIELPNGRNNRMIVGVQNVTPVTGVPGNVDLRDPFRDDVIYVIQGIETVIAGTDVDVVDVQ